jgi:hypothetical protein
LAIIPSGYTAYGSIGQYTLSTNLIQSAPTLAAALNSDLTWTWTTKPDGAARWFGQTNTRHDGMAAAQSGPIAQDEATGIFTTVEGAGTVSFWWKISAGDSDALAFATTSAATGSTTVLEIIHGQQDWVQRTHAISTTGTHSFGWTFDKASASTTGSAWVDQVVWTPANFTFTTTPVSREISSDAGQFAITATTSKTWTATTDADWLTLSSTAGAGNATLTVSHTINDTLATRHGTVTITSGGINRTCEVAQPLRIPFAIALNNSLVWTTGGDAPWTTQIITTHDSQHAARSGIIFGTMVSQGTTGQETWLQTTVNDPGTLSFWWKVSSEGEESDDDGEPWGDILYFHTDGEERIRTSGEKDWTQHTYTITGTGAHTLKWTYKKDPYLAVGADAAWLDQVIWTTGTATTLNISPDSRQVSAASGQFAVTVDTTASWNATSSASWLSVSRSSGSGAGTINATYATNTTTTARAGTITVTAGDLTDTCVVTQAAATLSGTSGNNNNNNNNSSGGGGGGGGAPGLWSLAAIVLLCVLRRTLR